MSTILYASAASAGLVAYFLTKNKPTDTNQISSDINALSSYISNQTTAIGNVNNKISSSTATIKLIVVSVRSVH